MSGIFGIVQRNRVPLAPSTLDRMRASMAGWAPDGGALWRDPQAGLGQSRLFSTPESHYDRLPRRDAVSGISFTAAARVDNRAELGRLLDISLAEQAELPDTEFLFRAYLRWGQDCPGHVYGDWAFAAWHPAERQLFLARDHCGNTSLFYYADPQRFAFASDRQALLELSLAPAEIASAELIPAEIDELYLAQVLVSWPAYHGERTIHTSIRRLPPAHTLTVTPERLQVAQYWWLEAVPELRLPRREDYVAAFSEIFDEAVRARLRTPVLDGDASRVAVTLSGGLDSSAVTATAAGLVRHRGQRVSAFTSVPLSDSGNYAGNRFGDELPFAEATARFAGNVDLHAITAASLNPVQAIRRVLRILEEPAHAAGNFYWIVDLEEAARARGCRVLLTGQMGNAGVSWTGDLFSQSHAFRIRQLGLSRWARGEVTRAKERLSRAAPAGRLAGLLAGLLTKVRRRRIDFGEWCRGSAIHPDFARRLNLLDQQLCDLDQRPAVTPREKRCHILMPGRALGGALHAQIGAAHDLEVRDPTGDARLLEFTLSVPDHIFMDPETGLDRWLIRQAMQHRLPDQVRLNRRRGRQAADLVPRLRACAAEVEMTLDQLGRGPAAAYVDVSHMREVWRMIQIRDTPEAFRSCVTILTRGMMAGLFVNQFEERKSGSQGESGSAVLAERQEAAS
jgi:asparagine synthase (glutamine-hydrolysing)